MKAIKLRVRFKNVGSVNKEGQKPSQQYVLTKCLNVGSIDTQNKNTCFFRHEIIPAEESLMSGNDFAFGRKFIALPKISVDTIRHGMYREQVVPINIATLPDKDRIAMTLCESILTRGNLETATAGRISKRKTVFYLEESIYADRKNPPVISFEVHAKDGNKEDDKVFGEDVSSNNFYFTEEISPNTWISESKGLFNLEELQFISMSDIYGRRYLFEDDFDTIESFMKEHYGESPKVGYFKTKEQIIGVAERGIMLSDTIVSRIAKFNLKRLLNLEIFQKHDSMQTLTLEIKTVEGKESKFYEEGEEGWITVDEDYIDAMDIKVDSKYIEVAAEVAEALISEIAIQKSKIVLLNEKKTADKKEKKDAAKAKKNSPTESTPEE